MTPSKLYEEGLTRISSIAAVAPEAIVAACPAWTVSNCVAHLCGLAGDWRVGNLDGYATDEWTAKHVADRRHLDLAEILAEWRSHLSVIGPSLDDPAAAGVPAFMPAIVLTDLAAHEHDLRHAVDRPGERSSGLVGVGLQSMIGGLRQGFAAQGLPTLTVVAEGWRSWAVGREEPVAMVSGTVFELFRTLTGRRTIAEAEALDWQGARDEMLPHLIQPPFSWRDQPLGE